MNKQSEAAALQVYVTYFDSYIRGDVKTIELLLDNEYTQIGSAETEVFFNKKDALQFINETIEQVAGKAEIRNRVLKTESIESLVLVNDLFDMYVLIENEWTFYSKFRASTLMEKKTAGWKFIHQHSSMPDSRTQDGDNIAIEKISAENLQLREAVKRRTVELEQKNRELEIETALERVRVVAMSMNKPNDMLEVCSTISTQLESLKLNDIRNVQTAIIYESKGIYLNYEYYRLHDKTFVTEVDYRIHPVQAAFAKKMLADPEGFYTEKFSGKELTDWYEYQKTTPQFADSYLEKATSLNYYWYSVGPVALGISTYSPLSENNINLFKRFRNVFALAYRRFIDIETAAAQTKEARIEASLERVRATALSMRKPDDLPGICEVLFTELRELGFAETRNAMINIHDDEKCSFVNYDYSDEIGKSINHLVYNIHPVIEKQIKQIRSGGDAFSETSFKGRDLEDWKTFRKKIGEKDDPRIEKTDALYYYFYSIGTGAIGISTFSAITDEKKNILKRFRNVFDFAYRRYMDVALAETQAREAQIELALERVRARTMAMQRSEELAETVSVLFKQLLDLGIQSKQLRTCGIVTFNQQDPIGEIWITDTGGEIVTDSFITRYDEAPVYKKIYAGWKKEEKFLVVSLFGDAFYEHINYLLQHTKIPVTDTSFIQKMEPEMHLHVLYFSQGYLFIITYKPLPEHHEIFKRFGAVFQQTYTRFLDFKKAEAQAREAEIELALERVRARTMAMQKSDELRGAVLVIYEQLQQLGFDSNACNIIIIDKESGDMQYWVSGFTQEIFPEGYRVPYLPHPYHEELLAASRQNKQYDVMEYSGEMKKGFDDIFFTQTDFRKIPEEAKSFMKALESIKLSTAFFTYGALQVLGPAELTGERAKILERFAKVFDLTYTRFLDLQKAEAQARESKIEVALERVRARSMAMYKSDELVEASDTMFDELHKLQIETIRVGIGIIDTVNDKVEIWSRFEKNKKIENKVRGIVPAGVSVVFDNILKSKKEKKAYTIITLGENEVKKHYQTLSAYLSYQPQKIYNKIESFHSFYFAEGSLNVVSHERLNDEECNIMLRFAKVFGQMYRRFLDLQKAEAQARESQIELGLERVRARAMAMQKSDELSELVDTVFKELTKLDFALTWCIINIIDESSMSNTVWAANPDINKEPESYHMLFEDYPFHHAMMKGWKERKTKYVYTLEGNEKKLYDEYLFSETEFKRTPEAAQAASRAMEKYVVSFSFSNFGGLQTVGDAPLSDANLDILSRFGKVFDLTYTRFNDLKLAEAQAKESQIQLAMERVRARTMAMQKSDELVDAANLMFQQIEALGVTSWNCGFNIWDDDKKHATSWNGSKAGIAQPFKTCSSEDVFLHFYEAAQRGESLYVEEIEGQACKAHYRYMATLPMVGDLLKEYAAAGIALPEFQIFHIAYFSQGYLMFITYEQVPQLHDIFKRFAKVFEQTYTRFLDLQKAEAQARESQIQLALERVRARTMAMQRSDELKVAAALLFQQVKSLGVPAYSCGYNIWENDDKVFTSWMSTQDGSDFNGVSNIPLTEDRNFIRFAESRQKGEQFFVLELRDERMQEHYQYLKTIPAFKAYFDYAISVGFDLPETQIHHLANFSQGNLLFITLEPCPEFHDVFKRFAAVFEQTYTRFLDLQKAEAQARESQIQLALERVRARTMAMQKSDELQQVVNSVYEHLNELKVEIDGAAICTFIEGTKDYNVWIGDYPEPLRIKFNEFTQVQRDYNDAIERREELFTNTYAGEIKKEYIQFLLEQTVLGINIPEKQKQLLLASAFFTTSLACTKNTVFQLYRYAEKSFSKEENDTLKRFANVFEQSYTRFLDLQKAEAQAKEAQIEAALEKVRSRSLAMHTANELGDVVTIIVEKLKDLGVVLDANGIVLCTYFQHSRDVMHWIVSPDFSMAGSYLLPYFDHPIFNAAWQSKENGDEYFSKAFSVAEKNSFFEYAFEHSDYRHFPDEFKQWIFQNDQHILSFAWQKNSAILIPSHTGVLPSGEDIAILKRFAKVFEQSYVRFLDLQKAEAQAREAQIESALERVRSRTMAMQRSDELQGAAFLLFQQVQALGAKYFACGFNIWDDDRKEATAWMAREQGFQPPFKTSSSEDVFFHIQEASQKGESLFVAEQADQVLETHYKYMASIPVFKNITDKMAEAGLSVPSFQIIHCAFFSQGYLMFISFEPVPDAHDIFKRFAKVFEQTYTRFLDLQKAEAQAREAQIETALEKVRSNSMGMRSSEDLGNVAAVMFDQMKILGGDLFSFGIVLCDKQENMVEQWHGIPNTGMLAPFFVPVNLDHIHQYRYDQWNAGVELFSIVIPEDYIAHHFELMLGLPSVKAVWDGIAAKGILLPPIPTWEIDYGASFKYGYLLVSALKPFEEDKIFHRFAKVFEQTYTRFLDLQKAEAQAREAQIETSLERVRSKTMAMHNSNDVGETVISMFAEFMHLGIYTNRCGILIFDDANVAEVWTARSTPEGNAKLIIGNLDLDAHKMLRSIYNAWKAKETFYQYDLLDEDLKNYYNAINNSKFYPTLFDLNALPAKEFHSDFLFRDGAVFSFTNEPMQEANAKIIKRFALVFGQTYRRYLDLQKAEAQARESQIQLALERVRARTMAMQKSDELPETSFLLFQQVKELGETTVQNSIGIVNEEAGFVELSTTVLGHNLPRTINVPIDDPYVMAKAVAAWKANSKSLKLEFVGQELKTYNEHRNSFFETKVNFPEDQWIVNIIFFSKGWLSFSSDKNISGETFEVLKRFAAVFEQTYIRFNDLKQAEAQAREAQIEAALERVRSRAMAMRHSEELSELVAILFNELIKLDLILARCIIWIFDSDTFSARVWMANSEDNKNADSYFIKRLDHPYYEAIINGWKERNPKWVFELGGEYKRSLDELLLSETELSRLPDAVKAGIKSSEHTIVSGSFNNFGFIEASGPAQHSEEKLEILNRFGKVFDLSYTRFNDLQKAEAQAREAQIELGLERVRARTMAMQHSSELAETASVLFQQIKELDFDTWSCGFCIWQKNDLVEVWMGADSGGLLPPMLIPYKEEPTHQKIYEDSLLGEPTHHKIWEGASLEKHYAFLKTIPSVKEAIDILEESGLSLPERQCYYVGFFEQGYLLLITKEPNTELNALSKRFTKVFEQTYTRFLDLKQAEAQAREAQIQLALERVRARTMAMQKSDELPQAANLLFQQVQSLGMPAWSAGYCIWDDDKNAITACMSSEGVLQPPFRAPLTEDPSFIHIREAYELGESFHVEEIGGEDLAKHYQYMRTLPVAGDILDSIIEAGHPLPTYQVFHFVYFSKGLLLFITYEPVPVAHDIFKRFGNVFDQTYTRFLDLQQAEAQAREAQIEAALERVRSRSMGMQKSEELGEVSQVLNEQLQQLNFKNYVAGFLMDYMDSNDFEVWRSDPNQLFTKISIPYFDHPIFNEFIRSKEKGLDFNTLNLSFEEKNKWVDHALKYSPEFPQEIIDMLYSGAGYSLSVAFVKNVGVYIENFEGIPFSEEENATLIRFAKVFEQTYTRFLDLQKAEAQAKEAQIETALEKVRSRSLAMRHSDELEQVVVSLFDRLVELGLSFDGALILIFEKEKRSIRLWIATKQLPDPVQIDLPYDEDIKNNAIIKDLWKAIENGVHIFNRSYSGETKNDYFRYVAKYNESKIPEPVRKIHIDADSWTSYFAAEKNSMVGFDSWSGHNVTKEDFQTLIRFAKVFEQTYTRFLDLQKAEAQAREAQIEAALERVRSRTMGMQKSEELKEVIQVVYEQFVHLNIHVEHTGFVMDYKTRNDYDIWIADQLGVPSHVTIPYFDCVYYNRFNEAKKKGEDFFASNLDFEEKNKFYQKIIEYVPGLSEETKEFLFNIPGLAGSTVLLENICLYIENFSGIPFSDEENITLMRFGKVFQQTYTRFLDLQKAESQAREAKIEAALERTRTQSMLMQHSGELDTTLRIFHQQLELLDIHSHFTFLWLPEEEKDEHIFWATWEEEKNGSTTIQSKTLTYPLDRNEPYTAECLVDWKSGIPVHIYKVPPAEVENYFAAWQELLSGAEKLKAEFFAGGLDYVEAYMKYGCFGIVNTRLLSEDEKEILRRFAVEFERTYTRFLDLQKAEAQAREAQIEAALEKVRSRSLAMHKSDELQEVVHTVFERLKELNVDLYTAIIFIFTEDSKDVVWWLENKASQQYSRILVPYADNQYLEDIFQAKENGKDFFAASYSFEEKNKLFQHLFEYTDFKYVHETQKKFLLESELATMSVALTKNIGINITSYTRKSFSEKDNEILKRFAKVFEQSYTRFLDLQKAEAQAKEARIEAALERVRSRTMAMQHSEELGEAASLLFKQIAELGTKSWSSGFNIWQSNEASATAWMSNPDGSIGMPFIVPYTEDPFFKHIYEARQSGTDFFVMESGGKELEETYRYMFNLTDAKKHLDSIENLGFEMPAFQITHCAFFSQGYLMFITYEPAPELWDIFKRFAKVFEQTYTRFLDLQKAEAQARDAQIEAALERVRSRTMAMYNSEDVTSATETMFEELKKLGIDNLRCGIANIHLNRTFDVFGITNLAGGNKMSGFGLFGMDENPIWKRWFESWKNTEEVFIAYIAGKEKEEYFNNINNHRNYLPQQIVNFPDSFFQAYYFEQGSVWAYSLLPHSEPEKDIMKRFATGFSLTFRRYQDLKQAEAQSREAQIELGLERVRARAMAMHKSDELTELVQLLFKQLEELDFSIYQILISIYDTKKNQIEWWSRSFKDIDLPQRSIIPIIDHPLPNKLLSEWKKGTEYLAIHLEGETKKTWDEYLFTKTDLRFFPPELIEMMRDIEGVYLSNAFMKHGCLEAAGPAPLPDDKAYILKRFAKVLDMAYTRMTDLQNAEALTREAQIELGLERVRARAMAMQKSDELKELIGTVFTELTKLDLVLTRCLIIIYDPITKDATWWMANSEAPSEPVGLVVQYHEHAPNLAYIKAWQQRKLKWQYVLEGTDKKDWDDFIFVETGLSQLPDFVIAGMKAPEKVYLSASFNNFGNLTLATLESLSEEHANILLRFAKVFDLTYTRFNDLLKAEAQAKEAIKSSSLDRVRAEIASMRSVDDLQRITPLIWHELTALGVPFIRCGVFIIDEAHAHVQVYLSAPDGHSLAVLDLPFASNSITANTVDHWRKGKVYTEHWNKKDFINWTQSMMKEGQVQNPETYQGASAPPESLHLHFVPFSQGMLYAGNVHPLTQDEIGMVKALAESFSIAYARYEDFKHLEKAKQSIESTLTELKATQSQLIQSEKMASLGQLTAGIAHEIQNPLNFVNNFSEVNAELIEELKSEWQKAEGERNLQLTEDILNDIAKNEEKIIHHGKRADAIVKGMLQHSRTSNAIKEPTDINKLADEYLRLAYHGLRAKDKSFNATLKTNFDESIGNIHIIPQDIGRVILNLITNAFYAVTEKKKSPGENYEPIVTVSTALIPPSGGGGAIISVKDNGNGIPQKILDKIFQPFFTTKPAGQGTGLGLSLAYDIVKAQGGELKVETTEGEGSEFIIQLRND